MILKKVFIALAVFLLASSGAALAANTYENISINYAYSATEYDNAPDAESQSAFINYVLTDEYWTSQIRISYLPKQDTQEDTTLTVSQRSLAAALGVLFKFNINKKVYWGPRFDYAYHDTKGTITRLGATEDLREHADSLTGMFGIGYCLTDKSDITLTYTYRDDFLSSNTNNARPVSLELLHTFGNDYSAHLRFETLTERPDNVDNAYSASMGIGITF